MGLFRGRGGVNIRPIALLVLLAALLFSLPSFSEEGYLKPDFNSTYIEAQKGDAYAQYRLAMMYSAGDGVPQNSEEALIWLHKSAEQGNPYAQHTLGNKYQSQKLYKEALDWQGKSAEQGFEYAQFTLGSLYSNKDLGFQNLEEAYFWYLVLSTYGTTNPVLNPAWSAEEAKKKLSSEQALNVQKRVKTWKPKTQFPPPNAREETEKTNAPIQSK